MNKPKQIQEEQEELDFEENEEDEFELDDGEKE